MILKSIFIILNTIDFNLAHGYVCLFNVESGHVLVCMYQSLAESTQHGSFCV